MTKKTGEKFEFQSEIKQLLDILVYSLYKNKEVFLRELVSNAVDALNKIKFELLTNPDLENRDDELKINISFNEAQKKLIIEDNGIGMTRADLIENLGTIAHSGTADFLEKLKQANEAQQLDMIGKFGVGFYSAFMVAGEIHVYTRSWQPESKALLWKSKGDSSYIIEETVKKTRGTRIELILKKDEKEFLEKFRIKSILKQHSQFIPFPLYLEKEKFESTEAIWTQPKSALKEQDYFDFFKYISNSEEKPATYIHLSSDAPVQFNAVLYIPKTSIESLGLFREDPGVDLYSRKVLIQKASKDLLPDYLRFVKGIVDSEDIPLNISRETFQNNIRIDKIKKHIIKKLIDHLKKMKNDNRENFLEIWNSFGKNLKEGIATDFEYREKLAELLMFNTSKSNQELVDLKTYTERMEKDQKEIYYATGMDLGSLEKNPALEAFHKKELEVLYLTDPLDEIVIDHLRNYAEKNFKIVEQADIKIDSESETSQDKEYVKKSENFRDYLKTTYGDRIADVKISKRLIESPCMLVGTENGPSVQMEKVMKMMNKDYTYSKKTVEINPESPLIREMIRIHHLNPASEDLKNLSLQLLDNMLVREGVLDKIDEIVPRMQDIMLLAARTVK